MSTEYVEVDSSYRNRNQYPSPADFVAEISQSGARTAVTAVDPVSDAAPIQYFVPFGTLSGAVAAYSGIGASGGVYQVVLTITVNQSPYQRIRDYFAGAVVKFTIPNNLFEFHRIFTWRYLETVANLDKFEVFLFTPLSNSVQPSASFSIQDPSDFGDPANLNVFIPIGVSATNYYINYIIFNETLNQWLAIDYYSQYSHAAHLPAAASAHYTPGTWMITDKLSLRKSVPVQYGRSFTNVLSTSVVQISGGAPVDNFYVGSFLLLNNTGESRRIISYIAATQTVTVSPAFSTQPSNTYQILQFTRDNQGFLAYSGSIVSVREAVCYDVELLNIVLPNSFLNVAHGARAVFYPYIYVEFVQINNPERQGPNTITSNNPNATRMLFRTLVNDSTKTEDSPFIRLDGNGMVQRIKLMPADSFRFSVHLPDGSLINTENVETFSPLAPNPTIQISALFSFTRV